MANSKRRCCHCKEYFLADKMFKTPAGWFCCAKHALSYAENKQKKDIKRALSERKRQFEHNDRSKQIKDAQKACNEFVRLRDKNKPCISCGRPGRKINAGHYRSVGSAPHLRFNTRNIHLQCEHCNSYLSGNQIEYRKGLIERYGVAFVEFIENDNEPRKLSIEEVRSIKVYYRGLVRRLNREKSRGI